MHIYYTEIVPTNRVIMTNLEHQRNTNNTDSQAASSPEEGSKHFVSKNATE